jgi:[acyl-carrier-protein] S-malonyltransferase
VSDRNPTLRTSAAIPRLADQVCRPVDWAAALDALGELGVDRIVDLGPGHALADMARDALADVRAYSTTALHSIEGLRDWVTSG